MKGIRVYADTSVFGGMYDVEFDASSLAFFEQVKRGRFTLVVSAVVQDEIEDAPEAVNAIHGYSQLAIVSPLEVINDEHEEDI